METTKTQLLSKCQPNQIINVAIINKTIDNNRKNIEQ